jgi:predicted DNA-binding mobile mystery protein A
MSIKPIILKQYQSFAESGAGFVTQSRPPEGWLRTMRKALGLSGAQLARKMRVTRNRIALAEKAELRGAATLKSMQAIAEAMSCRFVYAIVPNEPVPDLIMAQARKKAAALVRQAGVHMALENQTLSEAQMDREIERLAQEIAREMPRDLWDDKV